MSRVRGEKNILMRFFIFLGVGIFLLSCGVPPIMGAQKAVTGARKAVKEVLAVATKGAATKGAAITKNVKPKRKAARNTSTRSTYQQIKEKLYRGSNAMPLNRPNKRKTGALLMATMPFWASKPKDKQHNSNRTDDHSTATNLPQLSKSDKEEWEEMWADMEKQMQKNFSRIRNSRKANNSAEISPVVTTAAPMPNSKNELNLETQSMTLDCQHNNNVDMSEDTILVSVAAEKKPIKDADEPLVAQKTPAESVASPHSKEEETVAVSSIALSDQGDSVVVTSLAQDILAITNLTLPTDKQPLMMEDNEEMMAYSQDKASVEAQHVALNDQNDSMASTSLAQDVSIITNLGDAADKKLLAIEDGDKEMGAYSEDTVTLAAQHVVLNDERVSATAALDEPTDKPKQVEDKERVPQANLKPIFEDNNVDPLAGNMSNLFLKEHKLTKVEQQTTTNNDIHSSFGSTEKIFNANKEEYDRKAGDVKPTTPKKSNMFVDLWGRLCSYCQTILAQKHVAKKDQHNNIMGTDLPELTNHKLPQGKKEVEIDPLEEKMNMQNDFALLELQTKVSELKEKEERIARYKENEALKQKLIEADEKLETANEILVSYQKKLTEENEYALASSASFVKKWGAIIAVVGVLSYSFVTMTKLSFLNSMFLSVPIRFSRL